MYIENDNKRALQGDRIETPDYIAQNKLQINYAFYITNQIMKPLQQVFALVLEEMDQLKPRVSPSGKISHSELSRQFMADLAKIKAECHDETTLRKKTEAVRNKWVKELIFDPFLKKHELTKNKQRSLMDMMFSPATTALGNVSKKVRKQ